MYLRDLVDSSEHWQEYENLLSEFSTFVRDCVKYLIDAFNFAQVGSFNDRCYSHSTVLMLTRHVIESIDGVSVLVERGCAENCGPLLRSAFEGHLGLLYILEADSNRRALSYQVAHVHRKIKMYRRCDPNDALGKQVRAELSNDPMIGVFDGVPIDSQELIANLEGMLRKPEYAPIEMEWESMRKAKDKHLEWFALFGGPRDVRSLAIHLKLGVAYEGLYRRWSDVIHAGSGFDNVASAGQPGLIRIRPIRHPDGLQPACSFAADFCVKTALALVAKYAPDKCERFQAAYSETIQQRRLEICQRDLIRSPWR